MKRLNRLLLAGSGLVPLAGLFKSPPDTTLLVYLLFVLAVLSSWPATRGVRAIPWGPRGKFAVLVVASGALFEVLNWVAVYLAADRVPSLARSLIVFAPGFYGGWAVAWIVALRFFRFSLAAVFVTTGLFGVPLEQEGVVLAAALRAVPVNPLAGAYALAYVFAVYGSIVGLAYLPLQEQLRQPGQREHWAKYPLALLLLYLGTALVSLAASAAASRLGLAS